MYLQDHSGIISRPGMFPVEETVAILRQLLVERGIKLFALIDHGGEAHDAGMVMPPTKLLIFGSPTAGTPLMLAEPTSAIDLPLKLLVWEDVHGVTWLSYNDTAYLQDRHHLPADLIQTIDVVGQLAQQAIG